MTLKTKTLIDKLHSGTEKKLPYFYYSGKVITFLYGVFLET